MGTTSARGAARRELATRHPIALELDRLLVSRAPLMFEYVPRMGAVLFGSEQRTGNVEASLPTTTDRAA